MLYKVKVEILLDTKVDQIELIQKMEENMNVLCSELEKHIPHESISYRIAQIQEIP